MREGVRRQTVIWRQLLAGDKEPEAYLDRHARAGLRDDLRAPDLAPLPALVVRPRPRRCSCSCSRSRTSSAPTRPASCGPGSPPRWSRSPARLGITKVSILLTVRGRLTSGRSCCGTARWCSEVVEATLTLDSVLPPPARRVRAYGVLSSGGPASPDGSRSWGRPWSNSGATSVEGIGLAK